MTIGEEGAGVTAFGAGAVVTGFCAGTGVGVAFGFGTGVALGIGVGAGNGDGTIAPIKLAVLFTFAIKIAAELCALSPVEYPL